VLYFYPRDDTPGCTVEACEFTAQLPDFEQLDAVVLGCSADGAAAHRKFIDKHDLAITLLTDADKKVMQAYRAFGKKMMYGKQVEGVIRSTVLIAPDGKVAHHWATVRAAGHAEQVRSKLAELSGLPGPADGSAKSAKKKAARKASKATTATRKVAKTAARKAPAKAGRAVRRSS
jgi:peroxiredoxin Q/BCP